MFKRIRYLMAIDMVRQGRLGTPDKKQNITLQQAVKKQLTAVTIVALLSAGFFSWLMARLPIVEYPSFFASLFAQFLGIGALFNIMVLFNSLYGNQDFYDYASLPLSSHELFLSKISFGFLSNNIHCMPLFILFMILAFQSKQSLLFSIPMALIIVALWNYLLVMTLVIMVTFFDRIPWIHRYRQAFSLAFSLFGVAIYTIFVQRSLSDLTDFIHVATPNWLETFSWPFYTLITNPTTTQPWLILAGYLVFAGALTWIVDHYIIPHVVRSEDSSDYSHGKTQAVAQSKNLTHWLRHYQCRQFLNPNIFMQVFVSKYMLFLFMILPQFRSVSEFNLRQFLLEHTVPFSFWTVFILVPIGISFLTINAISFSAIAFSLDRQNLELFRALPLHFAEVVKQKLIVSTLFDTGATAVFIIVVSIFLHLPIWCILLMVASLFIFGWLYSMHYLMYDYRYLALDWNNINDLSMRGKSRGRQFLQFLGIIIGTMAGFAGLALLYLFAPTIYRHILGIVVLILFVVSYRIISHRFKETFHL